MKTVGFYGGAFDPFTLAHRIIVSETYKLFDELWLNVVPIHPWDKNMISPEHRKNIAAISLKDIPNLKIVMYPDYGTFFLMHTLVYQYPDVKFALIIGGDNADDIQSWDNAEQLINLLPIIVVPRDAKETDEVKWYEKFPHQYLKNVKTISTSSTLVRNLFLRNKKTELKNHLMPEAIDYINALNLYPNSNQTELNA